MHPSIGALVRRVLSRRTLRLLALFGLSLAIALFSMPFHIFAAAAVVTPNNPDGWQPANVRADATVAITSAQPRGAAPNTLGSLEFTTKTVTSGQDKADYVKYWGVVSGRTLGNLSALSYELYRASSSTTGQHLVPAFRLAYATPGGKTGYLIWENVYNGGSTSTAVPTDQWLTKDIYSGNFWMREFGPGATIQNYGVTLAEWQANNDDGSGTISGQPGDAAPHVLGPDTNIIGVEVGVGSGWGSTFRGFVDNVAVSFGSDAITANFEPAPQCSTDCYVDDDTGNDANGGTSFADAKRTIQAGVTQISSGGTVHVKDGVYNEAITISKPLTLEGAQHGVLAKGRAGAEAIIRLTTNQTPIAINASDVTVDGLTFDMSQERTPWAITALSQASYANLKLRYNLFTGNPGTGDPNQDAGGAYLFSQNTPLIEGNFFNGLGSHAIFLAGSSTNTVYRNNDSYGCALSNISTQDNTAAGHSNVLIENNRAVQDDMILFNIRGGTIRNNSNTGAAGNIASRVWMGGGNHNVSVESNTFSTQPRQSILVYDAGFGYGANSDITVKNNTITENVGTLADSYAQIDLRDVGGTNSVRENTITLSGSFSAGVGAAYGVSVRGSGTGATSITSNVLDGGAVVSTGSPPNTGVIIRSNAAGYGQIVSGTAINVANNFVKNFSNGVAVYDFVANTYGGLLPGVNLTVNLNSLTGNSANGVRTGASAPTFDAQRNWWGSASGPTAASNPGGTGDSVSGNASYRPWLCDGTDTSPAIGFQPNSTSCGVATKLIFGTQPGNGTPTTALAPQPAVKAVDSVGNVDASFTGAVTLNLGANPGGATFSPATVNAVGGVATYSGLIVNKLGIGYTFVASASGFANLTSSPFNVLDNGLACGTILDNFNRKDGVLGSNWLGNEGYGGYSIRSNVVQLFGGGPIYWKPTIFGSDQYVCKTLTKIDPNGEEQSLDLKVQDKSAKPDWRNGEIDVNYVREGTRMVVRVDTFQPGNAGPFDGWRQFASTPVTFTNGDVFGARALADGTVRVYKNGVLVSVVDTKGASVAANNTLTYSGNGSFFVNKGGRIGVWDISAPNAQFDDFGGGNVAP